MAAVANTQLLGETSGSAAPSSTSHGGRRPSRNKKTADPFLAIPDESIQLPEQPPPSDKDENGAGHSQTRLADFVLIPISMISFLLSLFVVDYQQRQWRLSQHSSEADSFWSRTVRWITIDPEPYQEPRDAARPRTKASAEARASDGSFTGWYRHKMHRAMAKLEIDEAFQMRGRVIVALLAWTFFGLLILIYATRNLYSWIFV